MYAKEDGFPGTAVSSDSSSAAHPPGSEPTRRLADALSRVARATDTGDALAVALEAFASLFSMSHVSLWQRLANEPIFRRVGIWNLAPTTLAERVTVSKLEHFQDMMARRAPYVEPDFLQVVVATDWNPSFDVPPVLVVPIVWQDDVVAHLIADRSGDDPSLDTDDLAACGVIATNIAILLHALTIQENETRDRKRLVKMLDELGDGIIAIDERGDLIHGNDAEQTIFGLSDHEFRPGTSYKDLAGRKTRLHLSERRVGIDESPMVRAMRGENVEDARHIVVRPDGSRRYVSTTARPIMIDGNFAGVISVTHDLTDERDTGRVSQTYLQRLEQALQRTELIADVVMEMNDLGQDMDLEEIASYAIHRICDELGATSGTLWRVDSSRNFRVLAGVNVDLTPFALQDFTIDDLQFAKSALLGTRPTIREVDAMPTSVRLRSLMKSARAVLTIPMRVRGDLTAAAILTFDEFRPLDEHEGVFAAVWSRQGAQRIDAAFIYNELQAAHGRLVSIVDQMSQAVVISDYQTGHVLVANDTADQLWGFHIPDASSVSEIPVQNVDGQPFAPEQHPFLACTKNGTAIAGQTLMIPQAEGEPIEVVASHSPFRDGRGNIAGCVSVLQLRSDFTMIDRAKDQFISVVSHELRNPLTALRGNLQLLQRHMRRRHDDAENPDIERVETALAQCDRVADLVNRMLDVSRAGMNRLDVTPESCDAVAIVKEVVSAAQSALPADSPVALSLDTPDSIPVIWDAARIFQVVMNLLQNAFRYGEKTPINVAVSDKGDEVEIRVRDHGPGVPPKIRSRLFRQYHRFDGGEGDEDDDRHALDGSKGLGIGLFISARLVRQHGGDITVSNANDGGAIFTVTLPKHPITPAISP